MLRNSGALISIFHTAFTNSDFASGYVVIKSLQHYGPVHVNQTYMLTETLVCFLLITILLWYEELLCIHEVNLEPLTGWRIFWDLIRKGKWKIGKPISPVRWFSLCSEVICKAISQEKHWYRMFWQTTLVHVYFFSDPHDTSSTFQTMPIHCVKCHLRNIFDSTRTPFLHNSMNRMNRRDINQWQCWKNAVVITAFMALAQGFRTWCTEWERR